MAKDFISDAEFEQLAKQGAVQDVPVKTVLPRGGQTTPVSLPANKAQTAAPDFISDADFAKMTGAAPAVTLPAPKQTENKAASVAKKVGGALVSSEVGTGESLASGLIPMLPSFKQAQTSDQLATQSLANVASKIREGKAAGHDVSHLIEYYRRESGQPDAFDYTTVNPASTKSNEKALGEVAGVGLDVLSAGSYGKSTKALPSFKLAKPAAKVALPVAKAAESVGARIAKGAAKNIPVGAGYGAAAALQNEQDAAGVLKGAAKGATVAGIVGGAVSALPAAKTAVKESAEGDYYKILNPTTKANKELAAKVSPGLNDRNVFVFTRNGLEDKATQEIQKNGDLLEAAYAELPEDTKLKTADALKSLARLKDSFTVTNDKGQKVVIDAVGYKNAQAVEQTIVQLGDQVSPETMRKARQILDGSIYSPTKGVLKVQTTAESSLASAQKAAADAFRNELNNSSPSIKKLSAEFSFWKNVQKVIADTNDRTRGKTPFTEKAFDAAAVAGGLTKGGLKTGGILGVVTDLLYRTLTSAAFKSVKAVTKNAIADAMAKGDNTALERILTRTLSGANLPSYSKTP